MMTGERVSAVTDRANVIRALGHSQHPSLIAVLTQGFEAEVLFA